jgi:histidyl-tRNA synthetase
MNRNLRMPFKRYEIGKVFRNGPVKLGRTREFYQCDVDCVGVSGAHIEAELVLLTVKCFKALGIEPVIKIGNRGRLVEAIQSAGITDINSVLATLDKDGAIKGLKAPARDEELFGILGTMGLTKYVEHAPYLARGLNIYTGTVWEVYDKAKRLPSAIGGGGRYDNIIGDFIDNNQKYPAVGISFGLEPICAILSQDTQKPPNCIDIIIIPMGTETSAQQFAETLRLDGVRTLVYLGGKSVGKAFEYANAEGIPFALVLGENELKSSTVTIKKMATGEQKQFNTNQTKQMEAYING